jgi:GNAT superfamily N-acetyltransferase
MRPTGIVANFEAPDLLFALYDEADDIKGACAKAAHHRLAVNGWSFFEIYRAGRDGDTSEYIIDKMAMAFCNRTGVPVGCAVAFEAWGDYNAGCFVRDNWRRNRVGSKLVNTLLANERRPVRIHDGVVGSKSFWNVMGASELGYIREPSAPLIVPDKLAA